MNTIENNPVIKTVQANTLEECIPKMISHESKAHPEMDHKQVIAVAYSKCRKKLGISKAAIVRCMEKEEAEHGSTLYPNLDLIKNSFDREDWITYTLILKNEGLTHEEIEKQIKYSISWIKRYVSPLVQKATIENQEIITSDKQATFELKEVRKSVLDVSIIELKKEKRIFEGWGSVEIKDSHGDIITIEGLLRIMPTYLARGAPIMFGHSNKHVGKVLKYEARSKEVNGIKVPGLWLKGQIFANYAIDDLAWKCVLIAKERNQPVLSLGATPVSNPTIECDETQCSKKYEDLQLYEFTVTNILAGSIGANQEAKIDKLASLEGNDIEMINIPEMVGGSLLKMKNEGTMPTDKEELVNLYLAKCKSCQNLFQEQIDKGLTIEEAKEELYKGLIKAMNNTENQASKIDEEANQAEVKKEMPNETPEEEQKQEGADIGAVLQSISSSLQEIKQMLANKEQPAPETAKSETAVTKSETPTPTTLEETLNKHNLDIKQFEALAKQHGFHKTGITPAPQILQKDLIKEKETSPDLNNEEDMLKRLAAFNKGQIVQYAEENKPKTQ